MTTNKKTASCTGCTNDSTVVFIPSSPDSHHKLPVEDGRYSAKKSTSHESSKTSHIGNSCPQDLSRSSSGNMSSFELPVIPLQFVQLVSQLPNFIPNTLRSHVFPCEGNLKTHLNNKKSCDCAIEVVSLLSREGVMYYIVKSCDMRLAISEDWFIVTPVYNLNKYFRMRTACHRCYHILQKRMPDLKSYIRSEDWNDDLLQDGDVEPNPGPGTATVVWHHHFVNRPQRFRFSLGPCKYYFILKIALSGNVEENPGPMHTDEEPPECGQFHEDDMDRMEQGEFPNLKEAWLKGQSGIGSLSLALEMDLDDQHLYICWKCNSWRTCSMWVWESVEWCRFCIRGGVTRFYRGSWKHWVTAQKKLESMWWKEQEENENMIQWLPEELAVDLIHSLGKYNRSGWTGWPAWEDFAIVRFCRLLWPDQGGFVYRYPNSVLVQDDGGWIRITPREHAYLSNLSPTVSDEWIPDLTEQGIEPNPGPRKGKYGKKGSDSSWGHRDRSLQHKLPFQKKVCNTQHGMTVENSKTDFFTFIKAHEPSLLSFEGPHSDPLDSLAEVLATAHCHYCHSVYELGPNVTVCHCFETKKADELFFKAAMFLKARNYKPPEQSPGPEPHPLEVLVEQRRKLKVEMENNREVGNFAQVQILRKEIEALDQNLAGPSNAYECFEPVSLPVPLSPKECQKEKLTYTSPISLEGERIKVAPEVTNVAISVPLGKIMTEPIGQTCSKRQRRALSAETVRKLRACGEEETNIRRWSMGMKNLENVDTTEFELELKRMTHRLEGIATQDWYNNVTEEQGELWNTYWHSFPAPMKYLLTIRPSIYFSSAGIGAHDLPMYAQKFATAWQNCPKFCPQGAGLCVLGWDGLSREMEVRNDILRHGMLDKVEPGQAFPRKRMVRYVVGPAPHANKFGFFYNELWTPDHYDELYSKGFVPKNVFGEFCIYERVACSSSNRNLLHWTIPSRFTFEEVDKNLVLANWWHFNKLSKSIVIVDSWIPNVFTDGATIHDGSYVNACRKINGTGFSYVEYWNSVVHGTATFFGQVVCESNLLHWSARVTDSEFRTAVSGWLSNMRVADRLWHSLMRNSSVQGTVAHPLNVFGTEEELPVLAVEAPHTGEMAREQLKDDVELVLTEVQDAVAESPALTQAVVGVKMDLRELDNRTAFVPGLCLLSNAYQDTLKASQQRLFEARRTLINLGSPVEEWEKSSIKIWNVEEWPIMAESLTPERFNSPNGFHTSCPTVAQMCTWAIQDGQKVSIYDLPKYDPERIELKFTRQLDEFDYSKARPELLYHLHFGDLYVPSPHASIWTIVMRCGKSLPEFEGEYDMAFHKFSIGCFENWNVRYDPVSQGLDSVTLETFLETIEHMNGASKRRRLDWFLSFMMGNKNVTVETMRFFTKTDESLFSADPDTQELKVNGSDIGFSPAGKPRSIFNAAEVTFAATQPDLKALKSIVKEKGVDDIEMGGYIVPMPKIFHHQFHTKKGLYKVQLRYMADTDNVQDAAWVADAWKGDAETIYIAVGGDDNATIIWWKGNRWELEGDLSMCDQSMRGLFADLFLTFLWDAGVPSEIVQMIRRTYTDPASFYIGNELVATLNFKEGQLKTGVSHTSFSNTFIVGLLMIFGLERLIQHYDNAYEEPSPEGVQEFLVSLWKELGITMKLKVFVNSEWPLLTFHKRYFVPLARDDTCFCAAPLPSSIVKMGAIRAPTLMSRKTFFRRVRESGDSRKGMAQHPWLRRWLDMNGCTEEKTFVKKVCGVWEGIAGEWFQSNKFAHSEEGGYGGNVNVESWALAEGDGQEDCHIAFCCQRYPGYTRESHFEVLKGLSELDPTQCHRLGETHWGAIIWACFATDYG